MKLQKRKKKAPLIAISDKNRTLSTQRDAIPSVFPGAFEQGQSSLGLLPKPTETLNEYCGSTLHRREQYSAAFEELSKKIVAEDESDALYLKGAVTEYSDLKTDSETDLENNPVHEKYRDSNTNVCIIHPFDL
ncbi:hypothetical protein AVEN_247597-1 [Araneus ventricosus]|uniref:Uncharacterized protein n=1 Tax=Araneus ventricosus TaxID=182803 RepID=A0A4Y2D9N3_ARAVE|nr:hypothetical protein AVEN_247597-1 [Araneus ventricosus]